VKPAMSILRKSLAILLFSSTAALADVDDVPYMRPPYDRLAPPAVCPLWKKDELIIDGITYSNSEPIPLVHFQSGHWAYLSRQYGPSTVWGRSLLVLAQTAYATRAKVRVACAKGNDIRALWIRY